MKMCAKLYNCSLSSSNLSSEISTEPIKALHFVNAIIFVFHFHLREYRVYLMPSDIILYLPKIKFRGYLIPYPRSFFHRYSNNITVFYRNPRFQVITRIKHIIYILFSEVTFFSIEPFYVKFALSIFGDSQ
jgi:hypothetical protein